jgi:hypothetical protein
MAVSLYTLLQALEIYIAANPQQFCVDRHRKSKLCYQVVSVDGDQALPPLQISFVCSPAIPGASTTPHCTLVGRRGTLLGIDGWFWGEDAETVFRFESNALTPLEGVSALLSEVPSTPFML